MESGFIKASFAKRFPQLYQVIQKAIDKWHHDFLKASRPSVYLGGEKLLALTTFGHKIILNTTDLQSIKPLLRQSPSDLVLSALFASLHTPHANYLYIQPSHSFHPICLASLVKKTGTLAYIVADTAPKLFEIASNLHLNDLEDNVCFIQGLSWRPKADFFHKRPLEALEPVSTVDKTCASKFDTKQSTYDAFAKNLTTYSTNLLEELVGDEFVNLRAIIFEKSSLHKLQESDFKSILLLKPSCYWLLFLSSESKEIDSLALDKLKYAKNLGYEIWQLPNFAAFDASQVPAFGKWLLLTNPSFA